MTRFIHICASQDDVFALDDQGDVYRYNFNVKAWGKLIADRYSEEEVPRAGAWSAGGGVAMLSGEPTHRPSLLGAP